MARLLIALFLLLSCATVVEASSHHSSTRHFFPDSKIREPALSPSGRFFATIRQVSQETYIFVFDLTGQESKHAIPIGEGASVLWLRWASDNRLLVGVFVVSLTSNKKYIKGFGARTIAFDRDGGNSIILFDGERRILSSNRFTTNVSSVLPNDPRHVLIPLM